MTNWKRGAYRLWLAASLVWCCAATVIGLNSLNVAWPFAAGPIVHIRFSDTETWDYPADWGEARIATALKERVDGLNRKEKQWAAALPETRKTECNVFQSTQFDKMPADCARWLYTTFSELAVPFGWESQLQDGRISVIGVAVRLAPSVLAPPAALLVAGFVIAWIASGFRQQPSQ